MFSLQQFIFILPLQNTNNCTEFGPEGITNFIENKLKFWAAFSTAANLLDQIAGYLLTRRISYKTVQEPDIKVGLFSCLGLLLSLHQGEQNQPRGINTGMKILMYLMIFHMSYHTFFNISGVNTAQTERVFPSTFHAQKQLFSRSAHTWGWMGRENLSQVPRQELLIQISGPFAELF